MQTLNKLFSLSRILTVLLLLTLFAGCSDDEGSTGEPGTLDRLFSYPVIQGCGTCHGPQGLESAGPNLTTKASFHASLVGKSRGDYTGWLTTGSACAGTYVTPSSVKNSSVLSAISMQNGAICDAYNYHTDHGGVSSGAALNDFILWIENGAPAN